MSPDRESLILVALAALITVGAFAYSLQRRSWSLWVLAFALTLVTLWISWSLRAPEPVESVAIPEASAP